MCRSRRDVEPKSAARSIRWRRTDSSAIRLVQRFRRTRAAWGTREFQPLIGLGTAPIEKLARSAQPRSLHVGSDDGSMGAVPGAVAGGTRVRHIPKLRHLGKRDRTRDLEGRSYWRNSVGAAGTVERSTSDRTVRVRNAPCRDREPVEDVTFEIVDRPGGRRIPVGSNIHRLTDRRQYIGDGPPASEVPDPPTGLTGRSSETESLVPSM